MRIEVAGEHNILYSLNMLGTDASATFVSIVESPKSLPVVLHLNHLQLEAPGSLHSLSSDDELIVEPEITYARRFGGTLPSLQPDILR